MDAVLVPVALFPIKAPAYGLGGQSRMVQGLDTLTLMGGLEETPGSWIQSGSAPAIAAGV